MVLVKTRLKSECFEPLTDFQGFGFKIYAQKPMNLAKN